MKGARNTAESSRECSGAKMIVRYTEQKMKRQPEHSSRFCEFSLFVLNCPVFYTRRSEAEKGARTWEKGGPADMVECLFGPKVRQSFGESFQSSFYKMVV